MISKNKKLISFLLVLCMMMTILPMAAFAEEGDTEDVVTVEIPVYKQVGRTSATATFEFELTLGSDDATTVPTIPAMAIEDNTVVVNGESTYYNDEFVISVAKEDAQALANLKLTIKEKDTEASGWTYDENIVTVTFKEDVKEDGETTVAVDYLCRCVRSYSVHDCSWTCKYLSELLHLLVLRCLENLSEESVLSYYELYASFKASLAESVCLLCIESCDVSDIKVRSLLQLC